MPRDALTRIVSPTRRRGRSASRAASASVHPEDAVRRQPALDRLVGQGTGPAAHDDEQPDDGGRGPTDLPMTGLVGVAELEHLAQDRHPARRRQRRQQLEGGQDRAGRGVVAVVEDRHVARRDEPVAVRCGPAQRQAVDDLVERATGSQTDGGRGERVVDRRADRGRAWRPDVGCHRSGG